MRYSESCYNCVLLAKGGDGYTEIHHRFFSWLSRLCEALLHRDQYFCINEGYTKVDGVSPLILRHYMIKFIFGGKTKLFNNKLL